MVAAKLAKMSVDKPNSANLQNNTSRAQAAELLNVSERSLNTARKVERQSAPELVEAVEQGYRSKSRNHRVRSSDKPGERHCAG